MTALIVFIALFVFVTVLGFFASRWRAGDLSQLSEWGLGGRRFGSFVTWFMMGGDLYTAYTFVAVPALVFGAGALGFFAIPYAAIGYVFMYLVFPRLWSVSQKRRLCNRGGFRARPLWQPNPRTRRGPHRHPRHHAVYRAAACRH